MDDELIDNPDTIRAMEQLKQAQQAQRMALAKVRVAEKEFLDCVTLIAKNLKVNQRWNLVCRTHIQEGVMAMIRAISQPDEK